MSNNNEQNNSNSESDYPNKNQENEPQKPSSSLPTPSGKAPSQLSGCISALFIIILIFLGIVTLVFGACLALV
ncbi:hypothetical protein [Pleionea sediminis]|uniref:hypothetical protein n=1 Tax=Pleionea sediminis TaxID=2569479 RepID=UPI001185875D|nr:hypothetical protein [Pleionea sediminis]